MRRYADMIARANREKAHRIARSDIFDTLERQATEKAILAEVGSLEAVQRAIDCELIDHPPRSADEMMAYLRAP